MRQLGPSHTVREWPSPIVGLNLSLAIRFPGKFGQTMERIMEEQRQLLESQPRTIIIGIPLLWLAHYRAAGGVCREAIVRRAADLFAAHQLAVLPADSPDTSTVDGIKWMCATWGTIHDIDDANLPPLMTIEDFLAKIQGV